MAVFPLILMVLLLSSCGMAIADETDLVWSTFLGDTNTDEGEAIDIDCAGNVYVTGVTRSGAFPTTPGAYDVVWNGWDTFVFKFNPTGATLDYSTFLGGGASEWGFDIAIDSVGCAYVTGYTTSGDFPTTPGAFDDTFGGVFDAFVTKLNATGSGLIYSTYLEGGYQDEGRSIAVDCWGSAYVTGITKSPDFPITPGAYDTSFNGIIDIFITKFDTTGNALDYSTFLGAGGDDHGECIAVDYSGNAYVAGNTQSSEFPTTPGAFDDSYDGARDAIVAKIGATGGTLEYSSFLGGSVQDKARGIAVDDSGSAYVVGLTSSSDFPTTSGAYDPTSNGWFEVFVVKLNASGSCLSYGTFLGGSGFDRSIDIALDNQNNAYVTGHVDAGFPVTDEAFDTEHNGAEDVFVIKLNPTGSTLVYATFLGGSYDDWGKGIATDDWGNVYVTGWTESDDFPTTPGAFDATHGGGSDVFVAKFDLSGYPVPVVLASFEAIGDQGCIILDWVTASELNCHRWEIHRGDREDGQYDKIGELPGHGSTETTHTYRWVDRNVTHEVTYYYKLKQIDLDGSSTWTSIVSAAASAAVPTDFVLRQNYPNPFNPATNISYAVPRDVHVTVKIYNVQGAEVATLVDADQTTSFYTISWNAEDLASGVYFCTLQAGEFEKTIKMTFVK